MKIITSIFFILLALGAYSQKVSLSGIVSDAETGETLVNAGVIIRTGELRGTTTDINGFFSLPGIGFDSFIVEIQFVGYEKQVHKLNTNGKTKLFVEVKLKPLAYELGQVNVTESGTGFIGDREIETSQHTLSTKQIQSIPTARNDVFKALRYLPGIEPTEPLSPLVSVRGSDPGENLIMLDGVTIYNPYHFMSSSGIFNMQTVKHVDMMVGGFGAEYGGRNASVINIATKDGNNSGLHGELIPSTAESKVFLEFPLSPKTTMMLAGRFNYDIASNLMFYSNNYFYDANFSITHRFSSKHRLTVKYFGSKDKTNLDFNNFYSYMGNSIGMSEIFNEMSLNWVNRWHNDIATVIWRSVISPQLLFRAQAYASMHRADNFSEMKMNFEDVVFDTSTGFKSKVNDYGAKMSLVYKPFYWNELKMGIEYSNYLFHNATMLNKLDNGTAQKEPVLISAFFEDKISIGGLTLRPGVRASSFDGQNVLFEPRVNAVLKLWRGTKIKAAWGKYNQHIVSMNTQEFEFNQFLDYYYPLSNGLPSISEHYIAGFEIPLNRQNTLSADFYYKDIERTYTFDLLQDRFEVFALSEKIVAGTGLSYGMELMWNGSFGKFSGWSSYTLSKSTRSFPHIMNGQQYDYDYDRRHSFKAVMNYQATKRISYSASFIVQSGVPRSVENTLQMYFMYDPLTGQMIYSPQYTVAQKNASRMPWLFYLDFGLQKQIVTGFGKDLATFFGADESYLVVNVYNALFFRRNVLYYLSAGDLGLYIPMGDNYLPTVSAGYTIKF